MKKVADFITVLAMVLLGLSGVAAADIVPTKIDPNSSINFYNGTFESAKVKAQGEGKLFFVDFYASWCTPCKWMEESAFTDPEVVDAMSSNYVPFKVDIDQPEGYDLKRKFNVKILPTILIFNARGELVERVEETLDARKLNNLLTFHAQNGTKVVRNKPNVSPTKPMSAQDQENEEIDKLYKEYKDKLKRENRAFSAQVGNFPDYHEAYQFVSELRKTFIEPIVVLTNHKDGTTFYKVCLGQFQTIEEANAFCLILINDFGYQNAIVH